MLNLWLTHPFRMFQLTQGYCPICKSSPPDPKCFVCQGTYLYGLQITSEIKTQWLGRFRAWLSVL